jgi:hypothetical protein
VVVKSSLFNVKVLTDLVISYKKKHLFRKHASEILDIMVTLRRGFVEPCQKYVHIFQCTYHMQNGLERRI